VGDYDRCSTITSELDGCASIDCCERLPSLCGSAGCASRSSAEPLSAVGSHGSMSHGELHRSILANSSPGGDRGRHLRPRRLTSGTGLEAKRSSRARRAAIRSSGERRDGIDRRRVKRLPTALSPTGWTAGSTSWWAQATSCGALRSSRSKVIRTWPALRSGFLLRRCQGTLRTTQSEGELFTCAAEFRPFASACLLIAFSDSCSRLLYRC
jgi:hypothetical protein